MVTINCREWKGARLQVEMLLVILTLVGRTFVRLAIAMVKIFEGRYILRLEQTTVFRLVIGWEK